MSEFEPSEKSNEVTRRQWLLILGRLAAVTGFSGVAPELGAALPTAEGQQSASLPPGLYYPSDEHLSHALGDISAIHTIPAGSETEYTQPTAGAFRPQFFSDEEFKVASRIVEILLGRVHSDALSQTLQWLDLSLYSASAIRKAAEKLDPLHRALAVAYYGEATVRELETADRQGVMRSGLAAVQELSAEQYGQPFLALGQSEQSKLVAAISAAKPEDPLRKFFELIHTEAARGYYTSAQGLKELDYKGNWYYATCPGCEQHRT